MTDANDWSVGPSDDQFELCLFGPGKGESVLVHLGEGAWLVVDSCLDESRRPAPLQYLDGIGVPHSAIQIVVATHWHDDHIGGLAQVVEVAPMATFVCSQALKLDEFLQLVSSADWRPDIEVSSGVHEFAQVLDELELTGRTMHWAIESRTLLDRSSQHSVRVVALSPSDDAVTQTLRDVGGLLQLQQTENRLAVPRPKRNPAAVVLHVQAGEIVTLLCADLEVDTRPTRGWRAVLDAPGRPTSLAGLIKISHHGSENGHDDEAWAQMVEQEPQAALTPFLRGRSPLPRPTDIGRMCASLPDTLITRMPGSPKFSRDHRAQQMAEDATRWIRAVPLSTGAVRFRRPLDGLMPWTVGTWGTARRLCDDPVDGAARPARRGTRHRRRR